MSSDYLTLGPTPCEETCYPANSNPQMERIEMNAYRHQILRVMANEFGDDFCVRLSIKKFNHDTPYSEVCVIYNTESEEETRQAFWIESNSPENWDAEAEKELKEAGFIPWNVPQGHKSDGDIVDDIVDEEITAGEELLAKDTRHLVWLICKDTHNPLRRNYFIDEDIWGPNYLAIRYELGNERLILERINHFNSYNNDSNVTYTVEKVDANLFPDHITSKNGAPPFAD